MKLFMPQSPNDLGIYRNMLSRGMIKPFEMPEGIEALAERVMEMMRLAQESGRIREAMKAAEILRLLAADNRQIALELDKLDRLDAGKPTQIHGQVSTEAQERIRRIVSVQRARANTENNNVGHDANGQGDPVRPGIGGREPSVEAGGGVDSPGGDHAPAPADRGKRAQGPQAGAQE